MSTHERNKENPSRNLLRVNIIRMRMEWKIVICPLFVEITYKTENFQIKILKMEFGNDSKIKEIF